MVDSSPRMLRWILWAAAASTVCTVLGLPWAAFVGPLTTQSSGPTSRVLRSATASAAPGEAEDDSYTFEEGQEVTLKAPAALAGTKGIIVEPVRVGSNDESYQVRLASGSIFNIPVQNMEVVETPKKSSSSASTKSPKKGPNLWSELKLSIAGIRNRWSKLFKKSGKSVQTTKKPEVKKEAPAAPPASKSAPVPAPPPAAKKVSVEEEEEFFTEGQQVTLLFPPALAGKPGTVVGATRGGDYAVQLQSGSVFHIRKDGMKADTDSGAGGGSGSVGGSGRGYGGGSGLPPSGTGSKGEPRRSNDGTPAWVKLVLLLGLFCGIFRKQLRRMLRELHRKKPAAAILRRLDIRPEKSSGSDVTMLVAILCLALYLMFPQIMAWFKEHVAPLMSASAETVVRTTTKHRGADGAGNTLDKWIAMWPLAVLVLASILFTEKSKLPWRTGESDDEEANKSPNQHSLKFDGLNLKDVNQDMFKAELRQRLHENGVVRSKADKINIELRSGSVIAVMRGPADILRSVKNIEAYKLRVFGIAPKVYKDHGPREVRFDTSHEEDDADTEKQTSYMVRRGSISRLPPASDIQEQPSSVPKDLEEFKAEIQNHNSKGFPFGSRSRRRPIPFLSPVAEEDSGPVICFEVEFKSDFGDRLMVVGDHRCHGEWDPEQTEVELFTDNAHYPMWSGFWKPKERSGLTHEYKLVVKKENGDFVWETIENRKVCLTSNERWLVKLKFNAPSV